MHVLTHFAGWALGLRQPWTWHTAEEQDALARHATGKRRLVELGCWQGVSTVRLRSVMAEDGILHAVDPYAAGRLGINFAQVIAHREAGRIRRGQLRWMRMTDVEAAETFAREGAPLFDFIFSDAVNSYEGFGLTWTTWRRWCAPGGVYAVSTTRPTPTQPIEGAGSVRYTSEVLLHDPEFELIEAIGSFTILRRRV